MYGARRRCCIHRHAPVRTLDAIVSTIAGAYFFITIFLIIKNAALLPGVLVRIFSEDSGLRQMADGGFCAVLINGVNAACLFCDRWNALTAYQVIAPAMLFIGGLAAYTFWGIWTMRVSA